MNNTQPLVSVIVPIYNVEKYLANCLDSLINQTLKDIEIICVDDGSTDDSSVIIAEYLKKDKRIIVVHRQNGGRSVARNEGLKIARGQYIMFCDADDLYKIDMCEVLYNTIKNNKTDIACCEISINYESDSDLLDSDKEYYSLKFEGKKECYEDDLLKIDGSVCNKIFNKSLIDKFDVKFPEGLVYEDAAFFFMYYSICKNSYFVKQPLYVYNRHDGSIMNETFKGSEKAIDHIKIMDFVYAHLVKNNLWKKYKKIFFNHYILYFNLAYRYSLEKDKKKVFDYAIDFLNQIDKKEFKELSPDIIWSLNNIFNKKYTKRKKELTFLQKIFSLKNSNDKKYKIIRILGFSIKIKRGNK